MGRAAAQHAAANFSEQVMLDKMESLFKRVAH
jgi:hypothetical protein